MRVEICGDLLVEPNSLRQQPSTVSSNCSDRNRYKNIQFSELNQIEVPIIGHKGEFSLNSREQAGVFGFTINEEEWSLLSKSHLGRIISLGLFVADLEPYERKKMCSLPKSFTPFSSSSVGDGGLDCDRNFNRSASNSILLRKCESLSPTPSQFLLNGGDEPNNNSIAHPSSLSKILLLRKSHEGFQEDDKENWLSDEGWRKSDLPLSEGINCNSKNNSAPVGVFGKERSFLYETVYPVGQDDCKVGDVDVEFLPSSRFPFTHSSTAVGTIGSHPNPIISCAEDHAHHHHHQDLSTSQQTSFPATIYNFNSVDPMLYAECYDDWNANVASLCENNSNSTPVVYPDSHSGNANGFALPSQATMMEPGCEAFVAFGDSNERTMSSGKAVEEVNTLSTFLSKFDDKVAAIWGHQGSGRSALGCNFLSVDGCISATSTPLGSSNPWGSPSSDISSVHVPEYRLMQAQQQNTDQVSLAADALLSAGFGLSQHDVYQHDHQTTSQNPNGRVNVCDLTISPPKGNYNIMHSMKQYFGTAPPEGEYFIIKRDEASSTVEELEKSLAVVNHSSENAGFVVVSPQKSGRQADIDLNAMAKALDSIDLENEVDEEWEIVEACNKGKQGYEGEDLLNSWKTHFRTVEQVETIASARGIELLESPVTAICSHQINPNLPEYRLFDSQIDGEYHIFHRPGQTLFPVKYKVFHQNEKSNQTEDLGVDIQSPMDASQMLQAYKVASADWSKCVPIPAFEFAHGGMGSLPRSTTPVGAYDCDGNVDFQPSEWCNLSKGVEYNGMWGEWAVGDDTTNSLFPGTGGGEYCDSGVDGVGSRSDYYDDMFGDYEGEYENFSGIGFAFTGFTASNDADTDYGQFQDATSLSGCDSSSISGKQAKSSKRSKTRLRPCKYFFLEGSCRRGNDCKFSHDSIACRYWAEGSCLKGQNCPYVHCFIDGKKLANHDEEYGLPNNETEKQYHLESETDFPALCSTKNTMLSSRQPMTLGFGSSVGSEIRRLEDSLESLTVFTDSNSSVVEEEVNEPRRLFLFERFKTSSPSTQETVDKMDTKKQNCDAGGRSVKQSGNHRGSEHKEWSETCGSNRSLSKSKSLGDANSSASWMRHSVSRSNSHTYTATASNSLGIPTKEKRKKKKH